MIHRKVQNFNKINACARLFEVRENENICFYRTTLGLHDNSACLERWRTSPVNACPITSMIHLKLYCCPLVSLPTTVPTDERRTGNFPGDTVDYEPVNNTGSQCAYLPIMIFEKNYMQF